MDENLSLTPKGPYMESWDFGQVVVNAINFGIF
jgi:hypothetical protein